jgi:hypothetical protein
LNFLQLLGDDESGSICFLIESFEVIHDFVDIVLQFLSHRLLLLQFLIALSQLVLQLFLAVAGESIGVVFLVLYFSVVFNLQVLVLLFKLDDISLQDGHLVPEVYFFVVESFGDDASVDGYLQGLQLCF